MSENRPRGREKNVTGQGKDIKRRGEGLGTGPVGSSRNDSSNDGENVTRSGGGISKIIVMLLVLLLGGGGGIGSLLFGGGTQGTSSNTGTGGSGIESLFGNLSGGNVSAGWVTKLLQKI